MKKRGREREKERERFDMGGARFPRNQFKKLVRETGPSFIVRKGFLYLFLYIEINGYYKIIQCQQP